MGFLEYFYIVYDYINYARRMGLMVGAGRGSACGSLVCYLLGITEVDPIKHGLYFERFLNVDRISMPDIDSDFEDRDMIKQYAIEKYGKDCTMEISTDKILKSVSAINHAYAAMNHYPPTHITSKIHSDAGVLPSISELYEDEEFVNELSDIDARMMDMAHLLEGAKFGTGVHASGFIISTSNIGEYVPIALTSVGVGKDAVDTVITNINPNSLEDFNLIKFDILGISKFKLIRDICGMAGVDPINFFDKYCGDLEVPKIYQDGGSLGTFQLTKNYSVQYAKKLKVKTLEDIAFLLSVIRPATLPLIKQVCKYLETGEEQEYHLVETREICRETHGLLIYQEQVMRLAVEYAGYTLNEADELRSVMGKKKQDKVEGQRQKFINGAVSRGAKESRASEVFSYVERFAKYGFNKSHAIAYGVLNLKMAILKDKYPMQFYAGFLQNEPHDSELLSDLLDEAIDFGFKFAYPSLRLGSIYSTVCKNTIYFGLMNIKGIKEAQVKSLVNIIQENKIDSLSDLFYSLPSSLCTKTLHDKLFACGAYRHFKGCSLHFIRAMQYRIEKGKNKSFKLDYNLIVDDYDPPDIIEACMSNKPNIKRIARKLSMCTREYAGMHKLYVKRAFKNKSSGISCLLNDGNIDFFAGIDCVFGGSLYDLNDKVVHCRLEISKNFNGSISRNILELIVE
jgi:DNA polymerase-3 subunit alpha